MSAKAKARRKKKKQRNIMIAAIITVVVIICAGIITFYAISVSKQQEEARRGLLESQTFYEGITVNGIPLGGKTMAQAKEALAQTEADLAKEFSITIQKSTFTQKLTSADIALAFNTDQILNEAMSLYRMEDLSYKELTEKIEELKVSGKAYNIDYTGLNSDSLSAFITDLCTELNADASHGSFGIYDSATNKPVQPVFCNSRPGKSSKTPIYSPDPLIPSVVVPETLPEDAVISGRFYFVPPQEGIQINQQEFAAQLNERVANKDFSVFEIPATVTPPTATLEELQSSIVLRSAFYTEYDSKPKRDMNLEKATGYCNNIIVRPGEVFSCNDTLGDRTKALGWEDAPAVTKGGADHEDQPGGGVCQIATTMYNAIIRSDLKIVYRDNHSASSAYVSGGMDATINTGTIDFKWENNTDQNIYIFMWMDKTKKTINIELYAKPFPPEFDEIKFIGKKVSTIPAPDGVKYFFDKDLAPGTTKLLTAAKAGSVYKSYKQYFKNGVQVGADVYVADSRYNAHPITYSYGPGYTPSSGATPTPPVTPTPLPTAPSTPTQPPTTPPAPTPTPDP